ncbi:Peroxidase [Mycena venus]|uniref:Peroxidase n=1 Tax=Mycena venus TaxID=2733690 RepID=A0A8H6XL84_9AGAR|nr:Peroxidase [Mycena venus]
MLSFTFLVYLLTVRAYVWPSPQLEALDGLRFGMASHDDGGLSVFMQPCDTFFFANGTGRSGRANAADWVRTAYHDMATHDMAAGTGGLDASIRFEEEQARVENAGDGFANTLSVLAAAANRYISIADSIAIGAITAIESCAGPQIAFRGGRIDALEPNAPGVPRPEQDLASHIASFARQGFTQTEMIGLVACGHTFGGVQHAPFPDIVPELNDPDNTESVAHFDSTFVRFDNNVATEYIAGTTQNPLVVGLNDTTNSDKRIFWERRFSDSPDFFASTCATLLARMLDTVPSGVQLTEVVTPLPVKPSNLAIILAGDMLNVSVEIRFWNMSADANRLVRVLWDDHTEATHNVTLDFLGVTSSSNGRYNAAWYGMNATLDAAAGIKSMRFAVDNKLEDQDGIGFPVQDGIIFSATSCATSNTSGRFDVAVRRGINPARVYLESISVDNTSRPILSETDVPRPSKPVAEDAAYYIWSLNITDSVGNDYSIGAEVGGIKFSTVDTHALADFPACSA